MSNELFLAPNNTLLLLRATGFNGVWRDESNYALDVIHGTGLTGNAQAPLPIVYDGRGFLLSSGNSGSYLKTPDRAYGADVRIETEFAAPNWQAIIGNPLAKDGNAAPNRDWAWTAGFPNTLPGFYWFEGGVLRAATGTRPWPFRPWEKGWTAISLDVDDGAGSHKVKFEFSRDGVTWTQLGDLVTATGYTGVTSIDHTSAQFTVGARTQGGGFTGYVYRARVRDGLLPTSPLVIDIPCDLESVAETATTFNEVGPGAQLVTLQNGSNLVYSYLARSSGAMFGQNRFLRVPFDDTLCGNLASATWLANVSFLGSNAQEVIFSTKSDNANTPGVYLSKGTSGLTPSGRIGNGAANVNALAPGAVTPLAETQIALVRDGGFLTLYVNGVAGTPVAEALGSIASANDFYIGCLPALTNFGDYLLRGLAVLPSALTVYQQTRAFRELKRRDYVHVAGFRKESFRPHLWIGGGFPHLALGVDAVNETTLSEDAAAEIGRAANTVLVAEHGAGLWNVGTPLVTPGYCRIFSIEYDANGEPVDGREVAWELVTSPQLVGSGIAELQRQTTTTNGDGKWVIRKALIGADLRIIIEEAGVDVTISPVPDQAELNLYDYLSSLP